MIAKKSWLVVLCFTLMLFGCQKGNLELQQEGNNLASTEREDCPAVVKQLADVSAFIDPNTGLSADDVYGTISVTDLGTDLQVVIQAKPGFFILSAHVAYGSQADVNNMVMSWQPCNGIGVFNASYPFNSQESVISFTIPEALLDANGCIWLAANVEFYNLNSQFRCTYGYPADQPNADVWKGTFQYCRCTPPPPPDDCGQLRTQTPGGWGAPPNGNNPGVYLHANFASTFPNGVSVGDAAGFRARWTTAQAITNYLPAGGQAKKLTQNYLNPSTNQLKNVLINHLLALTLSVNFDASNPDFGDAGVNLNAMIIGSGAFSGWSVGDFLVEANKVAGGTSNAFTVQEVLGTAGAINENYVDGNSDNGYLDCPE